MHRVRAALIVTAAFSVSSVLAAEPPTPGEQFSITPADLPAPYATQSVANPSQTVRMRRNMTLAVPEGFVANVFADDLPHPRNMVVATDGTVFLAQPRIGEITLMRDTDRNGEADEVRPFIEGLNRPHGLALHDGYLYVADVDVVRRYLYSEGATAPTGEVETLTAQGALGDSRGHWTRNLAVAEDGRIFVAIGSASNVGEDGEPRATVRVFDADGSNGRTYASGLRNPVGIAFYPGTDDLYVVVNERDGLGDELVPDYMTRLGEGAFYGWPYSYIGQNPDPDLGSRNPDLVAAAQVPDLLFRSHSAPLGIAFYTGQQFPEAYQGDAFVALHGSWNAAEPRGYMVARVPFEEGQPSGGYEAFATNFWVSEADGAAGVLGRPADVEVAADGSLLIADDEGGRVWRVAYEPYH